MSMQTLGVRTRYITLTESNFFQWHFFPGKIHLIYLQVHLITGVINSSKNGFLVLGYILCIRTEYTIVLSLLKADCKRFPLTDCTAFLSNLFLYFTVLTLQDIFMISNLNLLFWNFTFLLFYFVFRLYKDG